MISPKIVEAFNRQFNAEYYSSYLYLQMAAWFEAKNLRGCANWLRVQRLEEQVHAMKFFDHLVDRDAEIKLSAIDGPPLTWASPLAVFEAAYQHEIKVTAMIDNLVKLARDEKDFAADAFLQWFVTEQVEEEASTNAVAQKLKLVGNDGNGLLQVDRELAARVFTPPPQTGPGAPPASVGA